MFGQALTGPYGAVGWLTGYETIAEMEKAMVIESLPRVVEADRPRHHG